MKTTTVTRGVQIEALGPSLSTRQRVAHPSGLTGPCVRRCHRLRRVRQGGPKDAQDEPREAREEQRRGARLPELAGQFIPARRREAVKSPALGL